MNLIEDAWIPARRRSGKVERISPWQLTDGFAEDPFVGPAAPRPDFNGALVQFLIGLLQTAFPPETWGEWWRRIRQPPPEAELRARFQTIAEAFSLDKGEHRFLQDLAVGRDGVVSPEDNGASKLVGDLLPVCGLLIEVPTGKTLRDNTDHFVKRGGIGFLCRACSAVALFTLQTNAPLGGRGYFTGIRGGGPLTTLVVSGNHESPATLWRTCWENVLTDDSFLASTGNPEKDDCADTFPWMAKSGVPGDRTLTPEDCHPHQVFWAMPRRIRLVFAAAPCGNACDLCGEPDAKGTKGYWAKDQGISYEGPWKHPLSPYYSKDGGAFLPVHPEAGGVGYRHWLGLVQGVKIESETPGKPKLVREPSAVVGWALARKDGDVRLWAFGYQMSNKKACCWYESTMPILGCPEEHRSSCEYHVVSLVKAAELIAKATRDNIKKAMFNSRTKVRGNLKFIDQRFWQLTEAMFFESIREMGAKLDASEEIAPVLERWGRFLGATAESIFNDLSQTGDFDAADPKRIALSWRALQKTIQSKKFKQTLGLPDKPKGKTRQKGGKTQNV
ncbi:MAG: type I-E CRISPR-associated protein Cse1/CasA [Deferrisomatales bacterium]|nr:type I-E CRISPR-associated protein Cse1/CasA [Deferrisomatales bacterium]